MKHALNITTTLILCSSMAQAYAQSPAACIPTPSCTSLGYTSTTSCTDGLKCPFGNYWNCTHINKITELTNKITELEKVIGTSQSQGEICVLGSILYSDKSCYLNPQKGKTPIGVVVYVDGKGGGQAMALNSVGWFSWGKSGDISELTNYTSINKVLQDYASCENSKIIMAAGDKDAYPAVWAAHEYSTEGTNAGDWCLPAAGILDDMDGAYLTSILKSVNGTTLTDNKLTWSSSEIDSYSAWNAQLDNESSYCKKNFGGEVRPVIEF